MKTLQCRAHGGTFKIGPKRGRDPVNCGGSWPECTRFTDPVGIAKPDRARLEATNGANRSVPPAMAAKHLLLSQGWDVKGSARNEDHHEFATLTAARGDETLVMHWNDGQLIRQDYSLWHETPSANGKPAGSLSFNPDECTDRELVRALAGCKVTWWNVLGQKEETATIAPESIKIEHAYNGHGDETPGDRIVKFIEHGGAGYRAFRMAALLKVG